jgi:uncharacterized membrane protein
MQSLYEISTIFMGVLFLIGDNLPDEVCLFDSMDYTLDVTTCVINDNRTCNINTCTRTTPSSANGCRTAGITLLGISTFLNIILANIKLYPSKDKEFAIIGKTHQRWDSAFTLASKIVFFDQILSGIHDSIFMLVGDDSQTCIPETHVAGAVLYIISVIAWGILLFVLCYKDWPTTDLCPKIVHASLYIGLWVFYTVYIIADTPWPWECYTNTDLKKCHITARLVLLVFSLALVSLLLAIYCVTVCIPSLRIQAMHRLAFDDIGNDLQEMRKVYEYEDIPLICKDSVQEMSQQENVNQIKPHFSLKFDEGMRSASYVLTFTWDYDLCSAYKGKKALQKQMKNAALQRSQSNAAEEQRNVTTQQQEQRMQPTISQQEQEMQPTLSQQEQERQPTISQQEQEMQPTLLQQEQEMQPTISQQEQGMQSTTPQREQGMQTVKTAYVKMLTQKELKSHDFNPKTIIFGPVGFKPIKFILVQIKENAANTFTTGARKAARTYGSTNTTPPHLTPGEFTSNTHTVCQST